MNDKKKKAITALKALIKMIALGDIEVLNVSFHRDIIEKPCRETDTIREFEPSQIFDVTIRMQNEEPH